MADEEKRYERCFWCGKLKDTSIQETEETLKNSVINSYEPCDVCKETFAEGIHVIGVTEKPIVDGMFPISKEENGRMLYPTGSMFIANETFIKDLFSEEKDQEMMNAVLEAKVLMLPDDFVVEFIKEARKAQQGEDLDEYIDELDTKFGEGKDEENI